MLTTAPPRPAPRPRPANAPARTRPAPKRLRVISEADLAEARRRARTRRALGAAAVVIALSLFGVVVAHVLLMQGQFELERLQRTSANEQAEYDRMRLEVAKRESPDVVVAVAQERLGMVVPPTIRYLAPSPDAIAMTATTTPAAAGNEPRERDGNDADVAAATGPPASWATVKPHLRDG